MTITITEAEDEDGAFGRWVEEVIDATAARLGWPFDPVPLRLKAVDDSGELVGGLTGYIVQGWLFIKLLGIIEERRGGGAGQALLARAEDFARQNGLAGVYLDTFEFQAPRYYARLGYSECGRLPAVRGTPQRIWFAKAFGPVKTDSVNPDASGAQD